MKDKKLPIVLLILSFSTGLFSGCTDSKNLSGTYSGPEGLFIWVDGDNVKRFQLTISIQTSMNQIDVKGQWTIANGNFKINADEIKIEGHFIDDNKIEGIWSNGQSSGSWKATRD